MPGFYDEEKKKSFQNLIVTYDPNCSMSACGEQVEPKLNLLFVLQSWPKS